MHSGTVTSEGLAIADADSEAISLSTEPNVGSHHVTDSTLKYSYFVLRGEVMATTILSDDEWISQLLVATFLITTLGSIFRDAARWHL